MLDEEQLKSKLLFGLKVSELYVESGATTSDIATYADVPLSTVKRCLKWIRERKSDYLRLFPGLEEEYLDTLATKVDACALVNKKMNKWVSVFLDSYKDKLELIHELYDASRIDMVESKIDVVRNLRVNGLSMRAIAEEVGISLSSVHNIINIKKGRGK